MYNQNPILLRRIVGVSAFTFLVCNVVVANVYLFQQIGLDPKGLYFWISMVITAMSRLAVFSLQINRCKDRYVDIGLSWLASVAYILKGQIFQGIPVFITTTAFIIPFVTGLFVYFYPIMSVYGVLSVLWLIAPDVLFYRARML